MDYSIVRIVRVMEQRVLAPDRCEHRISIPADLYLLGDERWILQIRPWRLLIKMKEPLQIDRPACSKHQRFVQFERRDQVFYNFRAGSLFDFKPHSFTFAPLR